jgi:heme-degrading monooxygenase HmoA
MHKKLTAGVATLVSLALLAASVSGALQGAASIARPDPTAISSTEEILRTVSRLRELDIKQSVKSSFKTKDEIEQAVIRDLDENTSPAEFEATQKTLVKLGLIRKQFRLRDYVVQLLREQVAGFYEPKTGEFYLAAWLPVSDQKRVIAHELVHALQDQHFNLRRFENWPKGDSDAELAAHALIEGEATLVMIQYDFDQRGAKLDLSKLGSFTDTLIESDTDSDAKTYPVLANAPKVLKENLQFPYLYGAGFVGAVLKGRSWRSLDLAYKIPPASTEQIMHPERFLSRDNPVKIELADLLGALGPDWKKADADVNGEFGYLVALAEFIPPRAARTAAAGWGGDGYALFENKVTGATLLAQYTTWDSENDAREFFDAYSARTEKRYAAKSTAAPAGQRIYETREGLAFIEVRGNDVVMIEGAATREELARLAERVWHSEKKGQARRAPGAGK